MGVQDAKRFRFLVMLAALVGVALSYHGFVYLPHARSLMHLRNQRALTAMARNMEARLRELPYLMRSSLGVNAGRNCDPKEFFAGTNMKAFSVLSNTLEEEDCGAEAGRTQDVVQTQEGRGIALNLCRGERCLRVKVDVRELLGQDSQESAEFFDSIIVVASSSGYVLQYPEGGAAPLDHSALGAVIKANADHQVKSSEPRGQIRIGPSKYWVYGRPLIAGTDLELTAFALSHEASFEAQVERLPLGAMLGALTILALLVLSFPYLKLVLIGAREPLRRRDVYALICSALLGAALVTLLALDVAYLFEMRSAADTRLDEVASTMRDRIDEHIANGVAALSGSVSASLRPYTEDVRTQGSGESASSDDLGSQPSAQADAQSQEVTSRCLPAFEFGDLQVPDGYGMAIALASTGCQSAKTREKNVATRLIWVGDRDYFSRVANDKTNSRRDGQSFDLDAVHSRNSRNVVALITKRAKSNNLRSGRGNVAMVQLLSTLPRLLDTSVHEGVEAAIVDRGGRVLFHTRNGRAGTEQLLQETSSPAELEHALAAGYDTRRRMSYHGVSRTMVLRSLPNTPWRLVLISDNRLLSSVNAEVVTRAALEVILLLVVVLVVGFAVLWKMGEGWLWPLRGEEQRYWLASSGLMALSCGMVVTACYFDLGAVRLALVLGLFQLLGPLLGYAALGWKRSEARISWYSVRPAKGDKPMSAAAPEHVSNERNWTFAAIIRRCRTAVARMPDQARKVTRSPMGYVVCGCAFLLQMAIVPAALLFFQSAGEMKTAWERRGYDARCMAKEREAKQDRSVSCHSRVEPLSISLPDVLPSTTPYLASFRAAAEVARATPSALQISAQLPDDAFMWRTSEYEANRRSRAQADEQAEGALFVANGNARGEEGQQRPYTLPTALFAFAMIGLATLGLVAWPARYVFGFGRAPVRPSRLLEAAGSDSKYRLYVGGAGHPFREQEGLEVRVALHADVDITKAIGELSPMASRVVLTDLHAALWKTETRRGLLAWLRSAIVSNPHLRIDLFSQVNPSEWLRSQRRAQLRDSQTQMRRAGRDETQGPGELPVPDVREWSELLSKFTAILDTTPVVGELKKVLQDVPDLTADQRATLLRECGWHARLHRCARHVARLIQGRAEVSESEIVDYVSAHAVFEHRYIFSVYTREQKLIIVYVAEEGFVNPTLWRDVLDLEDEGVLVREPQLRVRARSFGRFVRRELAGEDLVRLEQAEPSRWAYVRAAATASLVLCVGATLWFEPTLAGAVFAALSPAIASVGNLFSLVGRGSGDKLA